MFPPSYLFDHEQVFAEFVWILSVFKAKLAVEIDCSGVRGLHFSVEVWEMSSVRRHQGNTSKQGVCCERSRCSVRRRTQTFTLVHIVFGTYKVNASPSVSVLAYSTIRLSSAKFEHQTQQQKWWAHTVRYRPRDAIHEYHLGFVLSFPGENARFLIPKPHAMIGAHLPWPTPLFLKLWWTSMFLMCRWGGYPETLRTPGCDFSEFRSWISTAAMTPRAGLKIRSSLFTATNPTSCCRNKPSEKSTMMRLRAMMEHMWDLTQILLPN